MGEMSGARPVLRYGDKGAYRHSRERRRFSGRNVHPTVDGIRQGRVCDPPAPFAERKGARERSDSGGCPPRRETSTHHQPNSQTITPAPHRHSRAGGRFSGRNIHPESTTTPSFPRTREPRISKARLFPHPGDHCKTLVIPAQADASADGTSIQNQQNPRHSADACASADGTSIQNQQRPRHSRGRGIQNQQSTPFHPIPATTTVPFARRGWTNP